MASNTPSMLQEELGFIFGKGRSLLWWIAVRAEAWGKGRELKSLSGLRCSIIHELRRIVASLAVSLSPYLKQVMILT